MPVTDNMMTVIEAVLAGGAAPADLDLWCTVRLAMRLSRMNIELLASSNAPTRYTRRLFTPSNELWNLRADAAAPTTTMRTIALPRDRVRALAEAFRLQNTGTSRSVQMHAQAPAAWHRTPTGQVLVTDPDAPIAPQVVACHSGGYVVITTDEDDAAMNSARHLREIGYRLAENDGWICLHASAATLDGSGILIVGDSGAGKSSIALAAATDEGGAFLANDRTMISVSADMAMRAVAMPGPIRLNGGTLDALGFSDASQWRLTRPKPASASDWQKFQGNAKLHILPEEWHDFTGTPLASAMSVDLILFPRVVHGAEHVEVRPISSSAARKLVQEQCMSPRDNVYVCDWLGIHDSDLQYRGRHAAEVLDHLAGRPAIELIFGTKVPYPTISAAVRRQLGESASA